jgi:hypothetical protein
MAAPHKLDRCDSIVCFRGRSISQRNVENGRSEPIVRRDLQRLSSTSSGREAAGRRSPLAGGHFIRRHCKCALVVSRALIVAFISKSSIVGWSFLRNLGSATVTPSAQSSFELPNRLGGGFAHGPILPVWRYRYDAPWHHHKSIGSVRYCVLKGRGHR